MWLTPVPGGASDGDGGFRITGLAPGSYTLEVRTADGFRTLRPGVVAGSDVRFVVDAALCKDPALAAPDEPIHRAIAHGEPPGIRSRSPQPVIWDRRVRLVGWSVPERSSFGTIFEMTLYDQVLAPIDQPWKVFVHVDGAGGRAGRGDHEPVGGLCPTSTWQPGDYIIDRFSVPIDASEARRLPTGMYHIWTGLFTGAAPRWVNMPLSDAPSAMRDATDRVQIATVILE